MANSEDRRSKLRPGEPGYVGRGFPPTHTQVKPKEIKNPWGRKGRPRGDAATDDFAAQIAVLLAQPISSRDGKSFTPAQVFLNGLVKGVIAGDIRALKFYAECREKYSVKASPEQLAEEIGDGRQRLIDEALSRREAKRASAQWVASDHVSEIEPDLQYEVPSDPNPS